MSVATFVPEIWASRLLTELETNLVYGGAVNRDYEGEISAAGDTVHINAFTDPTIGDYVPNSTSISPEILATADQTMVIDQHKYFAFYIDDVDKRQALGGLMESATGRAAYRLADTADQFVASHYTDADADNVLDGAVTTGAEAYDELVNLKVVLDEANVPTGGRWAIIPPWYHGLLLRHDNFIHAEKAATDGGLRNGMVGRAVGFDILISNNVPVTTGTPDEWHVLAGHSMGITFAQQILSMEAYRPESSFSDAVKGLHVYGARVVRPEAIAVLNATQS